MKSRATGTKDGGGQGGGGKKVVIKETNLELQLSEDNY
jgi:hypothetical protein